VLSLSVSTSQYASQSVNGSVCLPVHAAVIVSLVVYMSLPTHFGFGFTKPCQGIIDRKHFIFSQTSVITAEMFSTVYSV